jgi:hypothetical protein
MEWKGMSTLGLSHHASNKRARDIITNSIPWRQDEYDSLIRVGDRIGKSTPGAGNTLDWVYLVLESTSDKANAIEFKKVTLNSRL